jgi:hypothetical protein
MKHFYGEQLLVPRPTTKHEDVPLSAVRDCLFNIFAATLHTRGGSFIRNLRTRHAMVRGTHLSRTGPLPQPKYSFADNRSPHFRFSCCYCHPLSVNCKRHTFPLGFPIKILGTVSFSLFFFNAPRIRFS